MLRSVLCLLLAVACQFFCHEGSAFSAPGGWAATYGGAKDDRANVQQTSDGGYIVPGVTASFGAGDYDSWVLKLRADGTVEWQKTYGGASSDRASSIQQTRDGGYIVAGRTESFGVGEKDFWILKLKTDGTVEWQKTCGGNHDDGGGIIQQTDDGGYIASGITESLGAGERDIWVLRLRPDGSTNPACGFIKDTSISGEDSSAIVMTTDANPGDTAVNPQDSQAAVMDTEISANFLCP